MNQMQYKPTKMNGGDSHGSQEEKSRKEKEIVQ
jgi:hypothetical protein